MARKSRVITENEKKETVKVFVWKIVKERIEGGANEKAAPKSL